MESERKTLKIEGYVHPENVNPVSKDGYMVYSEKEEPYVPKKVESTYSTYDQIYSQETLTSKTHKKSFK